MSAGHVAEQIVARLTSRGVPFTIHEHVVARTVADALERLPFSPDAYLKTVAFRLKAGGWALAALRGADRSTIGRWPRRSALDGATCTR